MKNILIVDDDVNFRYAIRELVSWEEHDFRIIGEAIHGKQALEMIAKEQVDIVLTDMEMPIMNGVELTEQIKEHYPDILVIAMSAYDDFSFVKESMRLGASDYILKQDYRPDTLLQLLKRLSIAQNEERQSVLLMTKKNDKYIRYLRGELPDMEIPENCRDRSNLSVFVVRSSGEDALSDEALLREMKIIFFSKIEASEFLFVVQMNVSSSGGKVHERYLDTLKSIRDLFSEDVWIGYSEKMVDFKGLPREFERAETALSNMLYEPKHLYFCYQEHERRATENTEEMIYHTDGLEADEEILLSGLMKKAQRDRPEKERLFGWFVTLFREFHENNKFPINNQRFKNFYDKLQDCLTLGDMGDCFLEEAAISRNKASGSLSGVHQEIRKARRYIDKHFSEDISLKQLAEYIGLSENYFSNLFKKEMGENLKTYLNNVRIHKAKELLISTDLKDYEIAEMVGYNNPTYFAALFKKVEGMSVSDFRRQDEES